LVRFDNDLARWIEGARVDIASLETDDSRAGERRQGTSMHSSLAIRRHTDDTVAPQAEQAQCLQEGDVCLVALTTTAMGGARKRPCASTSQPAEASTAWRAAASPAKLAIVAPVTNAPPQVDGRPSTSSSQPSAISSIREATVAGSAPPVTKPK